MLRNQPLLNDKHVFFYTNSRAKPLDATQKKKKLDHDKSRRQ